MIADAATLRATSSRTARVRLGFAVALATASLFALLSALQPMFLNLFWQIPDGIAIVTGHPRAFVTNAIAPAPIVAQEWLFEAVLGWLVLHQAYAVFVFGCAIVGAALPLLGYAAARRAGVSSLAAGIAAFLTLGSIFVGCTMRAEALAVDLFALELIVLYSRASVWWLLPIVVLWANVHASAPLAVVAAAAFALGAGWAKREANDLRRSWMAVAVAFGATMLTPLGLGLWSFGVRFTTAANPVGLHLDLWAPLSFDQAAARTIVLPGLAVLIVLGVCRKRQMLGENLLAAFVLAATLAHQRFATFLVIAWLVPIARSLEPWLSQRARALAEASCSAFSLAPLALIAAFAVVPMARAVPDRAGPWQTAAQIALDHGLRGNAYTKYTWAAYLDYRSVPLRTLIDAHGDAYDDAIWRDADELEKLRPSWAAVLNRRNINVVIVEQGDALAQALRMKRDWALVEERSGVAAFRRVASGRSDS